MSYIIKNEFSIQSIGADIMAELDERGLFNGVDEDIQEEISESILAIILKKLVEAE